MGLTFPLARRLSRPLAHCLLSEGGQGITKADLLLATKGWYDTTPGALKTDLVAKFTAAYSESLRVAIAGTGLDFTGPFTLAAWVKGSVGGNGATQYVFNTNGYQLTVNPIGGFFFRLIGGSLITIPGGLTGNWQLVTLGFNGTDLVYSIDGVVDTIASAAPNVATGNFIIGTSDFEMGPAGAWDTDLSPPQIATLWNMGNPSLSAFDAVAVSDRRSSWPMWEPRGVRYDRWSANHLADINTVGAAHGPEELQAGEYAGCWPTNQGLAADPFGDLLPMAPGDAPQLIGGKLVWDGLAKGLKTLAGSLGQPNTIVVVWEFDSTAGFQTIIDDADGVDRQLLYNSGTNLRWISGTGFDTIKTVNDTDRHVLIIVTNGATSQAFEDGVLIATFEAGAGTPDGFTLGSGHDGANPFIGKVETAVLVDRILTSAEISALSSYYA